ncbi:MAG: DUF1049 domain-containing protein [Comamonadaceae bacterium CG17_big_fil_post_rev_8_21_14_2_50_60_13]|nr:MAG: DUF1049 domain-containing protein [Comamonadaceae bacterium CG17_big_fil_post_rev_8_21_14_2_50_60_13]
MKNILWLLKWVLKAAIFFTLFAFALNNQQTVTVHFFFGNQWHAPQVLVVLIAFAIGVAIGVLGMVPWRFKQRQRSQLADTKAPAPAEPVASMPAIQPAYSDGL